MESLVFTMDNIFTKNVRPMVDNKKLRYATREVEALFITINDFIVLE